MTATLLLQLAGPLQSWGSDSHFEIRRTELIPTKSGIVGMIAAALGRKRDADISDLTALQIGIRVDRPGTVISDFQTAKSIKHSYTSKRYYLADAVFLAGISSENTKFLETICHALNHPVYPLYLGRRSCPPGRPLKPHIVNQPLEEALISEPWLGSPGIRPSAQHLFLEGAEGKLVHSVKDSPETFDYHKRQFKWRHVSEKSIPWKSKAEDRETEHDPLSAWGD